MLIMYYGICILCVLVQDRLSGLVCPPIGKKAKFGVETIQTKSLIYGCAYMGDESLPMFHLWLERPGQLFGHVHGNCANTQSTYNESLLLQNSCLGLGELRL